MACGACRRPCCDRLESATDRHGTTCVFKKKSETYTTTPWKERELCGGRYRIFTETCFICAPLMTARKKKYTGRTEVKNRCGPWENYLPFIFVLPRRVIVIAGKNSRTQRCWKRLLNLRLRKSTKFPGDRSPMGKRIDHRSQQTTHTPPGVIDPRYTAADEKCAYRAKVYFVNNVVRSWRANFFFSRKPFKHVTSKNDYTTAADRPDFGVIVCDTRRR